MNAYVLYFEPENDVTFVVVHPTMEFKFCFSYVLLLTFTAVNEVTYVIGFTCDRLLDVVCFRVMVTDYGCGEVSFFADGTVAK